MYYSLIFSLVQYRSWRRRRVEWCSCPLRKLPYTIKGSMGNNYTPKLLQYTVLLVTILINIQLKKVRKDMDVNEKVFSRS